MTIEVGSILEGKVTGITSFGAFVELEGGKTGLVHISEVAESYVKDIKDYLKENDIVKVKVINLDGDRIGLSIRQVNTPGVEPRGAKRGRRANRSADFEERLREFLRDSEQRQQELKRSLAAKRGGRGSRRDG